MSTDNQAVEALMRALGYHPTHDGDLPEMRAAIAAALAAARERALDEGDIALREWAVSRWRDEAQNRPLMNKNRRPLDDTWWQVMRYAGLDPEEAVGPSHDALKAKEAP